MDSSSNGHRGNAEALRKQRLIVAGVVAGGLIAVAAAIGFTVYLLQPQAPTTRIKDTAVILLATEFLLLGLTGGLLIVQVARLVNLVRNEVMPVLESANETMNTVRGTAVFLSDNLTQPVMRVGGFLASARRLLKIFNQ